MTGYSGKPLWQKLGYKPGLSVLVINAPENYPDLLGEQLPEVQFVDQIGKSVFAVHIFAKSEQLLVETLTKLRNKIDKDGMVWVSWPKKASKIASDIDENKIRQIALPLGFVDVKVCAVDATWSALKLVIRKEER